ncbi:catechol 2,3-dioxygenase-like lactoylglutathione lyase family enzyme [Micromonospora vinacea]|uniref:Catechol 2,3-dioxygenase-like lactoylglutathione lyase family enzyme n=1 Tax=Micromonospora vinacea TaxID=709878 RepID=A0ABS0JUQ9_9ACTN|nr:VOC family protein [Micromonospora vinacea]MBG6100094.1 catechol 2,3-dioxygenase-like lactoylglutathione lyase family enzyme [Micromonospora vinacea]
MANGGNRPIAPVRKLIGTVLGTVATFVVLFGLGMTSWAIVALGVALLVLAIALATVRGGGRTWVVGVGHVHSASEPPTQYAFGRCELQLVIDAPGLPPRSKKIIEPRVPVSKWPSLGQTLPIRVALDDQRHVKVLWDEVPTHAETAAAVADLPPEFAEAEAMDELLIQQDAPPWADRAPDDDFRDDFRDPVGDPFRDPLGDPLRSDASRDDLLRDDLRRDDLRRDDLRRDDLRRDDLRRDDPVVVPEEREPVVMHQSPGGPVVLEGVLVEQQPGGLPRRATPAPRPPAEERFDEPAADRFDAPAQHGTTVPPVEDPVDPPNSQRSDPPPAQRSGPGAADPLDPLDLPLDDPSPAGAARATVTDEELDQAIFGFEAASAADPTAPISGVGLTLLVTDLPRSLTFYRDMLGFNEVDQGAHNAVLASGTTRIVLREVTGAAPISRRLVHVNLEVNDIETAYERLRESGVRFTYAPRVVNRGTKLEGWAAAFRDPDGHGVALTQWRERAEA